MKRVHVKERFRKCGPLDNRSEGLLLSVSFSLPPHRAGAVITDLRARFPPCIVLVQESSLLCDKMVLSLFSFLFFLFGLFAIS